MSKAQRNECSLDRLVKRIVNSRKEHVSDVAKLLSEYLIWQSANHPPEGSGWYLVWRQESDGLGNITNAWYWDAQDEWDIGEVYPPDNITKWVRMPIDDGTLAQAGCCIGIEFPHEGDE